MDKNNRQKRILRASLLSIIVNLCIAIVKIIIGMAASSIAIISEGMNNATDAGSSFLTLTGTKLSAKHPDREHPFGYGRIEYLTSLTVAVLIMYTGVSLIRSSIDGIIHPTGMDVSTLALLMVAASAVIKFFLGTYITKEGKEVESSALVAVGTEGRNDSFISVITIAVSVLYLKTHISLDAYAGILFAAIILKSGIDTLRETVSELIGRPGKKELAKQLYREIRSTRGILNAADMMLHSYGPDNYSGSVNIEIDHKEILGDIYEYLHELQLHIMHEYNVTLVFGIYAVNNDGQYSKQMRKYIGRFIRDHEHLISYHALYQSAKSGKIYCDFVVDYDLKDWDALEKEFADYMNLEYPGHEIELTVETEYV